MANILGVGGLPDSAKTQNLVGILGLSLRDYIAVQCAGNFPYLNPDAFEYEQLVEGYLHEARARYAFADAMLKVREDKR